MPLLYVDTDTVGSVGAGGKFTGFDLGSKQSVFGGGVDDLLTSRDPVTQTLHGIVEEVVAELLFQPTTTTETTSTTEDQPKETEQESEAETTTRESPNSQNIQPLFLKFRGLEMDGEDNSVLHAVGAFNCPGADVLRVVVGEITRRIEALGEGWRVYTPLDEPQVRMDGSAEPTDGDDDGGGEGKMRPRIPFMRLPHDFVETLPNPKGMDGEWENYSEEDKKNYIRFPEEGGNGISPIFWYKWWEDSFCEGKGIRMQELAVYGRTGPFGTTERAFYIPHLKSLLPSGNSLLTRDEIRGKEYDASRRMEQERMAERDEMEGIEGGGSSPSTQTLEEDLRRNKSGADRRMLQTIFDSSPDFEVGIGETDEDQRKENDDGKKTNVVAVDRTATKAPVVLDNDEFALQAARAVAEARKKTTVVDASVIDVVDDNDNDTPSEDTIIEASIISSTDDVPPLKTTDDDGEDDDERRSDKAAEIIGSIAKPIATGDWTKLPRRKDIPSPEDNPIFQQFRKYGTVTIPSSTVGSNADAIVGRPRETRYQKRKPSFPSDEYFVGIWRLQSTPSGPSIDERRLMGLIMPENDDTSQSENLILRADGLIAGGPILDEVNKQRAAGGTWRFFQAEYIGDDGEEEEGEERETRITTRLKVRLVIPPKKDRVLVMEGEVKRGPRSTPTGTSEANIRDMRSRTSTFSTIAGNNGGGGTAGRDGEEEETVLHCSGEVWVEDATGRGNKNRSFLGKFSLLKLKERDPNEYVYTIPAPKKIQD